MSAQGVEGGGGGTGGKGLNSPPGTDSVVSGAGGVKALLKSLNSKYADSHVKLPDGTVPTGKPAIPAGNQRSRSGRALGSSGGGGLDATRLQEDASPATEGGGRGGASGVKARLAEINSKHKNSFVRLPDGTVPQKAREIKKVTPESPHLQPCLVCLRIFLAIISGSACGAVGPPRRYLFLCCVHYVCV